MQKTVAPPAQGYRNARLLAEGLNVIDGLSVDMTTVHTNLAYLAADRAMPVDLVAKLGNNGVRIGLQLGSLRTVTHYGIDEEYVETALAVFGQVKVR